MDNTTIIVVLSFSKEIDMSILIQILITLIVVAFIFYLTIGFLTVWMNNEIFKAAKMPQMHWLITLVTVFIWPTMIKETLSGFKDTMALEIGRIVAAKNAKETTSGLGSVLGAMGGGLGGNMMGGIPGDTPQPDAFSETN